MACGAISVVMVVAYHLTARLAPGGFVGVDVFFVISGFLMTEIIVGRLRQGRFKLRDFYLARLRRIWPALAVLCAVLWTVGATLIDPWTFERIAADIPGALFFVSNIVFARRQGYFAPDENANWLLHTWSLSLEWQFYLLYPLLLLGLFAAPALRRRMWIVLGVLTAASFALALAMSARNQGWSFYLLPTRAWELLAGALCAGIGRLALGRVQRAGLHALGLASIGLGAWFAVPAAGWPSMIALLPVGGAAAVIVSAQRRTGWAENPVIDGLGARLLLDLHLALAGDRRPALCGKTDRLAGRAGGDRRGAWPRLRVLLACRARPDSLAVRAAALAPGDRPRRRRCAGGNRRGRGADARLRNTANRGRRAGGARRHGRSARG